METSGFGSGSRWRQVALGVVVGGDEWFGSGSRWRQVALGVAVGGDKWLWEWQ